MPGLPQPAPSPSPCRIGSNHSSRDVVYTYYGGFLELLAVLSTATFCFIWPLILSVPIDHVLRWQLDSTTLNMILQVDSSEAIPEFINYTKCNPVSTENGFLVSVQSSSLMLWIEDTKVTLFLHYFVLLFMWGIFIWCKMSTRWFLIPGIGYQ